MAQHTNDDLRRIRHSAAHILAQAIRDHFATAGRVLYGTGPATESGFFYDFCLPRPLSVDELPAVEKRVRQIIREDHPIERRTVTAAEALHLFSDQPFKVELLKGMMERSSDADGTSTVEGEAAELTVYSHSDWFDLCTGPHLASTGAIDPDAVKLLKVGAVSWRGDPAKASMTRVYGTAWRSVDELERYEHTLEEAERRDHRKLGKKLDLFHFDATAPGMPYWLPKGLTILNELIDYWRTEHKKYGYQEIATPMVNRKELWERSGHWEHYRDNMFIIEIDENNVYGVKPMNCPNAMVIFNLKRRSYRELPLRVSDIDALHRHEPSGSLHGLMRVQLFRQDDAHIFVSEDEIDSEYEHILKICDQFYDVFGMKYRLRLGTRPKEFIGDLDSWDRAEDALRRILDKKVGRGEYSVEEGDGAFYGPKIDILVHDSLARQWQMGTLQLDFQLPRRFNCKYVSKSGAEKTPVVIHRVIYGSLERFVGILIEHYAGAFPLWISPVQARLIPIADRHMSFCEGILKRLEEHNLRAEIDDSSNRMNAKIRSAEMDKIPYMLIVGDKELDSDTASVRLLKGEDIGTMSIPDLISRMEVEIRSKTVAAAAHIGGVGSAGPEASVEV